VTFLPERAVRGYLQENLSAAALAAWRGESNAEVARQLLQHPDQKFRLNYVLGSWADADHEEEDWGFDDEDVVVVDDAESSEDTDTPTEQERRENQRSLEGWVAQIRALAEQTGTGVTHLLGIDWTTLKGGDLDAAEEVFSEAFEDSAGFDELVSDIFDAILRRFDYLESGQISRTSTRWPITWELTIEDRAGFLRAIRWFSSNFAPRYGRLLTPLVQGTRVRGPFFPVSLGREPRLVLIDGQGLGHTPDSASSVTTTITSRFGDVDVILLVDNAQQPMQAAPLSVIRAIAVGGHQEKLVIAFTHFDQVRGANLPSAATKREHVLFAVRNALNTLRGEIGQGPIRGIEQDLDNRCFMLGWLDQWTDQLRAPVKRQLADLFDWFEGAIEPEAPIPATPIYDPASLLFAVQAATQEFHERWEALLGLRIVSGQRKEHWTRVKALNRRIADRWPGDEYDNLRPVADLFSKLSERISAFLDQPVDWQGDTSDVEDQARAIDSVRRSVSAALYDFSRERLIDRHIRDWTEAYGYSGPGSTLVRARGIRDIYADAAPVPSAIINPQIRKFLDEVRSLAQNAITEGGGRMEGATTGA
jgi:hypothetical protein